ncbi:MAG TPA: DUF2163 domain-containing protein, partial [Methanosarcina sp.]|nr:DUF2163 domain-containing protein [Methanosarcina sp.]
DSTELTGVFIQVTEADLLAGKYDNADLTIYLYDWKDSEIVSTQFRGNVGSYSIGYVPNATDNFTSAFGKQYQLEALSISQKLDVNISTQTSSECRHKFLSQGYGRCNKVPDSSVRTTSEITDNSEGNVVIVGFGTDNWVGYKFGTLKFTSGILEGTEIYISDASGLQITLLYPPPLRPSIGDTVELTRHCPKTLDACRDYNNLANYGGFPKLPGVDLTITGVDDV